MTSEHVWESKRSACARDLTFLERMNSFELEFNVLGAYLNNELPFARGIVI